MKKNFNRLRDGSWGRRAKRVISHIETTNPALLKTSPGYIVIDNALPGEEYQMIAEEFRQTKENGLSFAWDKDRFSFLLKYSSFVWTPNPKTSSSRIFLTHTWLDYVTHFFPHIKRTNNTGLTFFHSPQDGGEVPTWGSDSLRRNGPAFGGFKHDPLINGVNPWFHQCVHAKEPSEDDAKDIFYEVRAIIMVYFLNNKIPQGDEGGVKFLITNDNKETSVSILPVNNRLVIFEATASSFYSFKKNVMQEQNYLIQAVFEKEEDAYKRIPKDSLSLWNLNNASNKPTTKKTMLLIGSGGLLGTALIEYFKNDYSIVGIARTPPSTRGDLYDFIQGDIVLEREKVLKSLLERYKTIDIIINNAVFYDYKNLIDKNISVFEKELQTNVLAPFSINQAVMVNLWSRMPPQENYLANHLIINIGSISGITLRPNIKQATYSTTKSALTMLTHHMAHEWVTYGVRVNMLSLHGLKKHLSTKKVAEMITRCIQDASLYGKIIDISEKKTRFQKFDDTV